MSISTTKSNLFYTQLQMSQSQNVQLPPLDKQQSQSQTMNYSLQQQQISVPQLEWKIQSICQFPNYQLLQNEFSTHLFKRDVEISDTIKFESAMQTYHQTKSILIQNQDEQSTLQFYQAVINLQPLYPNLSRNSKCKDMFQVIIQGQKVILESPMQEAACAFYNLCNIIAGNKTMTPEQKVEKINFYSKFALQCVNEKSPIYTQIWIQTKIAQCGMIEFEIEQNFAQENIIAHANEVLIPQFTTSQTNVEGSIKIEGQEKLQYSNDPVLGQSVEIPKFTQSSQQNQNNNQNSQVQLPQIPDLPIIPSIDSPEQNQQEQQKNDEQKQQQNQQQQEQKQDEQLQQIETPDMIDTVVSVKSQQSQQSELKQSQLQQQQVMQSNYDTFTINSLEKMRLIQVNTQEIIQIYQQLKEKNYLPDQLLSCYYFYTNLDLILLLYQTNGDQVQISQLIYILQKLIPNNIQLWQQIQQDFQQFVIQLDINTQLYPVKLQQFTLPQKTINLEILPTGFNDTINWLYQDYIRMQQQNLSQTAQLQQKNRESHRIALTNIQEPKLVQLTQLMNLLSIDINDSVQLIQNSSLDLQTLISMNNEAQQVYQAYNQLVQTDQQQINQFQNRWKSFGIRTRIVQNVQQVVDYSKLLQSIIRQAQQQNISTGASIGYQIQQAVNTIDKEQLLTQIEAIKQQQIAKFNEYVEKCEELSAQLAQKLSQLQTVEQIKQYILQNNLLNSIVLNKRQFAQQNAQTLINQIVGNTRQQIQSYEKEIQNIYTSFYQQLQQLVTGIYQANPILNSPQAQKFSGLIPIAQQISDVANDIDKLDYIKRNYSELRQSYQQQMQSQWPMFCNGGQIVLQ